MNVPVEAARLLVRQLVEKRTNRGYAIRIAVSKALSTLERDGGDMTGEITITVRSNDSHFKNRTIVEARSAIKRPRASFDYEADAADNERDDAGQ